MDAKIEEKMREIDAILEFLATSPEFRNVTRRVRIADDKIFNLKKSIAIDFGERYGWRLSSKEFGPKVLARGGVSSWEYEELRIDYFDHPFFYRKRGRAVALAAHLYAPIEINDNLVEWAAKLGLTVWFPEDFPSWHFHGHTRLVVYVAKEGLNDLRQKGVNI